MMKPEWTMAGRLSVMHMVDQGAAAAAAAAEVVAVAAVAAAVAAG